jgi:hypothetical protein
VPYVMMSGLPMAGSAYGAVSLLKPFSQDALMRAIADSIACHQQAFSTLHNDLSRALPHDDISRALSHDD